MTGVRALDRVTGQSVATSTRDMVVNAAGPWADKLAALAGIRIPLALSPGIHVMIGTRLTNFVINRMHLPGSGDFIAPQRNTSILGTSSWSVQDCDYLDIPEDHIRQIRAEGALLAPIIAQLPVHSINAATRPLIASGGGSERELSRTFQAFDHAEQDNVEGFVTIAGGKLITARAMAEKISDVVCHNSASEPPVRRTLIPWCLTGAYTPVEMQARRHSHSRNFGDCGMYDPTAFTIPEGLNYNDHVVATYLYQTAAKVNIHKLAVALSEEQSSGTWVELPFESDVIRQRHVGKVVAIWEVPDYEDAVPEDVTARTWVLQIAYPIHNFGPQIPLMLTTVHGNISAAGKLKSIDLHFPAGHTRHNSKAPSLAVEGIRDCWVCPTGRCCTSWSNLPSA